MKSVIFLIICSVILSLTMTFEINPQKRGFLEFEGLRPVKVDDPNLPRMKNSHSDNLGYLDQADQQQNNRNHENQENEFGEENFDFEPVSAPFPADFNHRLDNRFNRPPPFGGFFPDEFFAEPFGFGENGEGELEFGEGFIGCERLPFEDCEGNFGEAEVIEFIELPGFSDIDWIGRPKRPEFVDFDDGKLFEGDFFGNEEVGVGEFECVRNEELFGSDDREEDLIESRGVVQDFDDNSWERRP